MFCCQYNIIINRVDIDKREFVDIKRHVQIITLYCAFHHYLENLDAHLKQIT